ncbi:hypothetical protein C8R43DRAFT_1098972 [Mycena crocata]|nr:hypothetical protein C8R43DRAFT_1098972 [Mycena crocata]
MSEHTCEECPEMVSIMRVVRSGRLGGTEFPPKPADELTLHRILTKSSESVQPDHFIEAGCAVCGQLTPMSDLTPLDEFQGSLDHLRGEGVTRRERFTSSDPIEELPGPVLADGCTQICVECEVLVLRNLIPRNALANHNWVGIVPPQLQGLTYAEGVMIARVRHNRCVIRVNSGRVRMHANAIMFAQPALKVYLKLPPSRDEISEVLAFVFTGSAAPTMDDFERTPMLVRRHKVAQALEWLKLNHEDYADLEISQENLESYALRDIPVGVDFKRTEQDPTDSIPNEARSHGTTDGECTFAVHAPMSAIKAAALQHLAQKGDMLAIGRSDIPESMYHNVKAYPGMFPWLFPYGKGDMTHKKNLLLYHDKRFQTDIYFPMLKGSAQGSQIFVKRSKLLTMDPDRMADKEHVKPCFALLNDLDGVGAHHMRNEIWSTTAFLAAPTWFITLAFADINHPRIPSSVQHSEHPRSEIS